jgi:GST-like protein
MIDFYYWPTPNGWKVSIMLEECGLDYKLIPLNIFKGDQFAPDFLKIAPNHRMPVIVDHDVDGEPIVIFESGAILYYLAEKYQQLVPRDERKKNEVLQWLFWQTGNQSPTSGQLSHFVNFAEGDHPYSKQRFDKEYKRCLNVLERQLDGQEFIVGEYSIADIICFPWILFAKNLEQHLDEFPRVAQWRQRVKERPGVQRGVDLCKDLRRKKRLNDDERRVLFGQNPRERQTVVED